MQATQTADSLFIQSVRERRADAYALLQSSESNPLLRRGARASFFAAETMCLAWDWGETGLAPQRIKMLLDDCQTAAQQTDAVKIDKELANFYRPLFKAAALSLKQADHLRPKPPKFDHPSATSTRRDWVKGILASAAVGGVAHNTFISEEQKAAGFGHLWGFAAGGLAYTKIIHPHLETAVTHEEFARFVDAINRTNQLLGTDIVR